jgi:hypothetical protein
MKTLIQIEELTMFVGCIYLYSRLNYKWWLFPILLLVPDTSMIGYLINPVVGALTYNIVHFKGTGILIGLIGLHKDNRKFMLIGIILLAHACMDRSIGTGLKYFDGFWHTSLSTNKFW